MKKVMIVDDSRFVYEELKYLLNDTQYEVAGYADKGETAVEEYERVQPDVVTMDIILPGMDGIETTHELMKKWPDARILMVSSLAYEDTVDQSMESGAKDFIYKPFDKSSLLEALDKICGGE